MPTPERKRRWSRASRRVSSKYSPVQSCPTWHLASCWTHNWRAGWWGPTPVEPVNVDRPAIERTATSRDPARVEAAQAGPSFVPFRNGRSWQSCDRLPVARLFNCCVLLPLVVCFPAEAVAVSNLDTPPPSFSSPNTRSHATHTTQDLESPRRSISVSKIADTRTRWWWVLPLSSPPPVVVAGRLGLVVASESKIAPSSSTC